MFRKVIQRFVGFIESWCKLIYFIGSSYIFLKLLDCKVHIFSEGLNFIWQSNYLVFLQKSLALQNSNSWELSKIDIKSRFIILFWFYLNKYFLVKSNRVSEIKVYTFMSTILRSRDDIEFFLVQEVYIRSR